MNLLENNYLRNAGALLFCNRITKFFNNAAIGCFLFRGKDKYKIPRNSFLFGLMQRMELVEKAGSGLVRIERAMRKYKLPKPKIIADKNWFNIALKRPDLQQKSIQERIDKTTNKSLQKTREKTREKILKLIKNSSGITTRELANTLDLSDKGIEWNLNILKQKGILRRIGPDKGGYWQIVDKIILNK